MQPVGREFHFSDLSALLHLEDNLVKIDDRQNFLQMTRNAQKEYQKNIQTIDRPTEPHEIEENELDKAFLKVIFEG